MEKRYEGPRGQISSSGPTPPCRSWSSGTPTPSLRFKRNPPWPIGCPLARLYADSLRHVPKGAQRRRGTLWIMSAGHLFLTLMQPPTPPTPTHHMISHERSENYSFFHIGMQTDSPRQQPWQAPVISSAMAFRSISWLARHSSSALFMHLEVFVNSSEGSHTERNKGRCVLHNIRGSSDIKVWERLL